MRSLGDDTPSVWAKVVHTADRILRFKVVERWTSSASGGRRYWMDADENENENDEDIGSESHCASFVEVL